MLNKIRHQDILTCIANLSSDEVFTPPNVVNDMLDLLPKEIWKNKDIKFLDPVSKSGVFLREITKRLLINLESEIKNKESRLEHILKNQVFGISTTQLTGLISRRSTYLSKLANNKKYSVVKFNDESGNIKYFNSKHVWTSSNTCKYCGANKEVYNRNKELESYAYSFIHTENPRKLLNMKFDVIIGNPPYQLNVGNKSGNSSKAKAIYHKFIQQAIKLNPRFLCMITPSRWMTKSTEGIPSEWVEEMLNSNKIREIHDYPDEKLCFPGVDIEGGVSYFLWQNDYQGKCSFYSHIDKLDKSIKPYIDYLDSRKAGIVIRDNNAQEILNKIEKIEKEYYLESNLNFSSIVSPKDFFTNKSSLTSSWKNFKKKQTNLHNIKYYLNKNIHSKSYGWICAEDIPKNFASSNLHKVLIPAAHGGQKKILGDPFYSEPKSVCSQTYLVIGYDVNRHKFNKKNCLNIISYIKTKFFRYHVSIRKKTQNGPRAVYQFVPLQNFNESWDDKKLYNKYNLNKKEIDYIESMITDMN